MLQIEKALLYNFYFLFLGETCEGAQVEAVGFTSEDATLVTKIAYIADFALSCSNGAKVYH